MAVTYDAVLYVIDNDDLEYVGPFDTYEAAQDYVDERNSGLANAGIPGSVASWTVV